jgi:hypothetical protein
VHILIIDLIIHDCFLVVVARRIASKSAGYIQYFALAEKKHIHIDAFVKGYKQEKASTCIYTSGLYR